MKIITLGTHLATCNTNLLHRNKMMLALEEGKSSRMVFMKLLPVRGDRIHGNNSWIAQYIDRSFAPPDGVSYPHFLDQSYPPLDETALRSGSSKFLLQTLSGSALEVAGSN